MDRDRLPADAAEILRLESLLLKPEVRRDRRQVEDLLAEDFVEFGASGRIWSRDAILTELEIESYAPPVLEDFECRMLSPDVVLVTYRTVRTNIQNAERDEVVLRSSIWRHAERGWRLSFHQGTRASRGVSASGS
jgi:hypothetical protein